MGYKVVKSEAIMKRAILCILLLCSTAALATVNTQTYTESFTCTGGYGPFPFTFPISSTTALTVTMNGTQLLTANYTVVPVNNNYNNGGNVTLGILYPCTAGWTLVLTRETPITQTTQFHDNMPIPMSTFERSLDKLTEIAQELNSGQVSLASPPPIGNVTPNSATFTTVKAQSYDGVLQVDQYCTTPGTLDGTCLINALAAAPSTGCLLTMPEGTLTATTAQLPITVSKACVFQGRGRSDTIVTTADTTKDIFDVPTVGAVIFRDFTIARSATPSAGAGIHIGIGQNVIIDNMRVTGQYDAVNADGATCFYLMLYRSTLDHSANDGLKTQCQAMTAIGNYYYYNAGHGIEVYGAGGFQQSLSNQWYANQGYGIWYHNTSPTQTWHNGDIVDSSGNDCVHVSGLYGFSFVNGWAGSCGISFSGGQPQYGTFTNAGVGISVDNTDVQYNIITNNIVANNGGKGILCYGCPIATIAGNQVNQSGQTGVSAAGIAIIDSGAPFGNITLTGNLSMDINAGTAGYHQACGLQLAGGVGGTTAMSGNNFSGAVVDILSTINGTLSASGNMPTTIDNNQMDSGAPTGSCRSGTIYTRTDATGGLYVCVNTVWTAVTIP